MVKIDYVSVTLGVYATCITVLTGMTRGGDSVSIQGLFPQLSQICKTVEVGSSGMTNGGGTNTILNYSEGMP